MLSKFIIATDLSPASYAVVNCLGGLKVYGAKHCLLLQCLSIQEASSVAASYTTAKIDSRLNEQKQILEKQGFKVETKVVPMSAKWEINRIANEDNYSFIVVGSHGHSMVGGVASDVIHNARKPVLVVRLENKQEGENICIHASRCDFSGHILFPTDFSENADQAFTFLEKLVSDGIKHVTLLHIQDKARIEPDLKQQLDEFNKIDRERLEKMKATLQKKGNARVDIELVYGAPLYRDHAGNTGAECEPCGDGESGARFC